jgi:hypothetical protein
MEQYRSFDEIRRELAHDLETEAAVQQVHQAVADALALGRHREEREGLDDPTRVVAGGQAVSCIQHANNLYLTTLREYVRELGGELHLDATFADEAVSFVAPNDGTSTSGVDHAEPPADASTASGWSHVIAPGLVRRFESESRTPLERHSDEHLQHSVEQLRGALRSA